MFGLPLGVVSWLNGCVNTFVFRDPLLEQTNTRQVPTFVRLISIVFACVFFVGDSETERKK